MSMELTLDTLLKTICPRVFADLAPEGTVAPYITWQGIGGPSMRYGDNTSMEKRDTLMQVSVWATTRTESLSIIRQAEAALCIASFQCKPEGEPNNVIDPTTKLRGSIQRFSIFD